MLSPTVSDAQVIVPLPDSVVVMPPLLALWSCNIPPVTDNVVPELTVSVIEFPLLSPNSIDAIVTVADKLGW